MSISILNHYINILNFLSRTLGPDYEIALFDLENISGSIIAIVNGHITGRSIGYELTPIIKKKIAEKHHMRENYYLNYNYVAPNGNVVRSSTLYIKSNKNDLIGVLCINFDDSRYRELSEKVFELCHPDNYVSQNLKIDIRPSQNNLEKESENDEIKMVDNAAGELLDLIMRSIAIPVERLTKNEKIDIIKQLDDNGFFMLKGAIPYLREQLKISQPTIYRYLKLIKK